MSDKLTAKQEAFCKEIVAGKTQYEAYVAAFSCKTQRRNTIDVQAAELRSNPKIARRIAELAREIDKQFEVEVLDLLRESARIAFVDPSKIIDAKDPKKIRVMLPHELDEDTRRAVKSFKIDDLGRIEYTFWDKNNAQERLFKFKGMYERDNRQKNPLTSLLASLSGTVLKPGSAMELPPEDED